MGIRGEVFILNKYLLCLLYSRASHLIFLLGPLAQTFLSRAAVNLLSHPKLTLPPKNKLSLPQAPGIITTVCSMSSFPLPCTYIKNKQ